jgi:hypothetical protein
MTFTRKSSAWKCIARSAAVSKAVWDDGLKSIGNRIFLGINFKVRRSDMTVSSPGHSHGKCPLFSLIKAKTVLSCTVLAEGHEIPQFGRHLESSHSDNRFLS